MRRHRRIAIPLLLPLLLAVVPIGCGERETPEERLRRIRAEHEIVPLGWTTVTGRDGTPATVVDLRVTNQGLDALDTLTVTIRVVSADGVETEERVALDLEGLRPGTSTTASARLAGFAADESDELQVELAGDLSDEELRGLPEFDAVAGTGG